MQLVLLSHCILLEHESKQEENLEQFKAQTLITNPELYDSLFADNKENIEKEVEWVHPEEDELADIIAAMKEQSES